MPDFKTILYNPVTKTLQSGGLELLNEWASDADSWVWLDISG